MRVRRDSLYPDGGPASLDGHDHLEVLRYTVLLPVVTGTLWVLFGFLAGVLLIGNRIIGVFLLGNRSSRVVRRIAEETLVCAPGIRADRAVPADRAPHRFREFSWTDDDMRRRNGRGGLAFAICRGIVEAHGGRLSAETAGPGRGVRFTFTLPVVDEIEYRAETGSTQLNADSRRSAGDHGRILAVDDDPQTRRHIRNILSEAGFITVLTGNPGDIERLMEVEQPHLVLMGITLPWSDGFELMERARKISDAPVIFVSGHGSAQNMDRAFELGAADYVVKPFTPTELVARIRAALRKRTAPGQTGQLEPFLLGDLAIDYAERHVTVEGRQVHLTATEYKLLFKLSTAAGRVLTHGQLMRLVWGPLYESDVRIVHTYVKQLRNKLGDNARRPVYIFTERRVGYRMARPATA